MNSALKPSLIRPSRIRRGVFLLATTLLCTFAGRSLLPAKPPATPNGTVPPTPTGLTATGGNAVVSLSWGSSSGATSYKLYRRTTSGGEGTTPYASGITTTSYTDNGVTSGTTYYYKVAAVNTAGMSAQSSEANATPLSVTGRGASVPYKRYESEDGSWGGGAVLHSDVNFDYTQIAAAASNQRYVGLPTKGSYVEWTMAQRGGGAGVDMRFTLPDTANGMGQSGSLDCYVNGTKVQTINLSSYWSWQYFAISR